MEYRSTRGAAAVTLDTALVQGIADDGGLFLPVALPHFDSADFEQASTLHEIAAVFLRPMFEGSALIGDLDEIIAETFAFPIPVSELPVENGYCGILELFHGPTAAFKDVGARFLAACLTRLEGDPQQPLTILVATSGDTGGAVAAAFDEQPGMRVAVLYPDGRVSERQAHQLTCWGDNVLALAVKGSFDDCQSMVKAAMADTELSARHTSARRTASILAACCRRESITRLPRSPICEKPAGARRSSFRPVISATLSPVSWRATWDYRSTT